MAIEYRELTTNEEFNQCVELQKNIFDFSDIDIISPLFLKLIARNNPPIGLSMGIFKTDFNKSELIGFIIGFATFLEKSLYSVILGIKPEYQNKIYGYKLMLNYRDVALSRNIEFLFGLFDPLEANIARFNISSLGYIAYKYIIDSVECFDDNNKYVPNDKIVVRWDINTSKTIERINGIKRYNNQEILNLFPIATSQSMPEIPIVLVEIPEDFNYLLLNKIDEALAWRISTCEIFKEYINKRQYIISDCFSIRHENNRKTYYLLEKQ